MNPFVHARTAADLEQRIDALVRRKLHADGIRLWLFNDQEQLQDVMTGELRPLDGPGFASWAALYREVVASDAPADDPRGEGETESRGILAVPLLSLGLVVGVLETWHTRETAWGKPEEKALQAIGEDVAAAIIAVRTREDLDAFSLHATEWIMAGVEARAPGGAGHHFRVCRVADFLAANLWFSPEDRQRIFRAAQYHDVGWVVGTGHKAWELEQYHPIYGAQALRSVRLLAELAPLVEMHHERYDGSGRPMGLKGDAVPLEAYILALAEDFDETATAHAFGQPEAAGLESEGERFAAFLEAFVAERRGSHHPRVLKTLEGDAALRTLWPLYQQELVPAVSG